MRCCKNLPDGGGALASEYFWIDHFFAAEHFFSLGLLGTIIGLTIATQTSLKDTVSITEVVTGLKVGLNNMANHNSHTFLVNK